MSLFAVTREAGPGWTDGKGAFEQPAHLFELPPDYEKPFPILPNETAGSFAAAENPRAGAFIAGKLHR